MPVRITVPADRDPMEHVWTRMAQDLLGPAQALSGAVYTKTTLPLREMEVARVRIAHINDCTVCRGWRTSRDVPQRGEDPDLIPEELYQHVLDRSWEGYTERDRLAIEFAERFALDHLSMGDAFWDRMHAAYSDDEIVELTACVGYFVAFGRFNQVLGIDAACQLARVGMHRHMDEARSTV
jgi:alkylhydroperoxidase family enzyme